MALAFHRLLLNSVFGLVIDLPLLVFVGWLAFLGLRGENPKDEGTLRVASE